MTTRTHGIVGAHVSAAGGVFRALEHAQELGVSAIQIFGSSPRQWQVRAPKKEEVETYKSRYADSGVEYVFLHAPYLANLASPKADQREKSIRALTEHLRIVDELDANGLIFHVGSVGAGNNKDKALDRVAHGIKAVLHNVPGSAKLIMENGSGGGGKVGSTVEDIATIVKEVGSKRVGVCIDTAHAYAAGVLVFTPEGINDFFDNWEQELGKGRVCVLHTNDSQGEAGSYKDRHANIGEGHIGKQGFKNLAQDERAASIPWILEVPGFEGTGPDKKNVGILKRLTS